MAKRPQPGKCVHCLADPVERNWDHVFPKSWYPDSTAPNLYKWQIPSCILCNSALGKIEEEFLVLVAHCLDPNDPASSSIVEKAKRAINPELAKNETDRRARESLSKRIASRMSRGTEIPQAGIYPTLKEKWGRSIENQTAVRIPAESFRRLTEKIVRGIFLLEDKKYIEPPYSIGYYALDDAGAQPVREFLAQAGSTYAREPGIVVRRAVTQEDGVSSVFEIKFWDQFKTHASVIEDDP